MPRFRVVLEIRDDDKKSLHREDGEWFELEHCPASIVRVLDAVLSKQAKRTKSSGSAG